MKLMEMSKNMIKDNWLWADQQWDDIAKKNWKFLSILKFPSPREQLRWKLKGSLEYTMKAFKSKYAVLRIFHRL